MPGMFINLRVEASTSRFCINRVSRDAKGAESVQRVQREVVMRGDHMIRSIEKMHFPLRRAGRPRAHFNSKASAGYAYPFLPPSFRYMDRGVLSPPLSSPHPFLLLILVSTGERPRILSARTATSSARGHVLE